MNEGQLDNLVLEQLRAIRGDLGRLDAQVAGLKERFDLVEQRQDRSERCLSALASVTERIANNLESITTIVGQLIDTLSITEVGEPNAVGGGSKRLLIGRRPKIKTRHH